MFVVLPIEGQVYDSEQAILLLRPSKEDIITADSSLIRSLERARLELERGMLNAAYYELRAALDSMIEKGSAYVRDSRYYSVLLQVIRGIESIARERDAEDVLKSGNAGNSRPAPPLSKKTLPELWERQPDGLFANSCGFLGIESIQGTFKGIRMMLWRKVAPREVRAIKPYPYGCDDYESQWPIEILASDVNQSWRVIQLKDGSSAWTNSCGYLDKDSIPTGGGLNTPMWTRILVMRRPGFVLTTTPYVYRAPGETCPQ